MAELSRQKTAKTPLRAGVRSRDHVDGVIAEVTSEANRQPDGPSAAKERGVCWPLWLLSRVVGRTTQGRYAAVTTRTIAPTVVFLALNGLIGCGGASRLPTAPTSTASLINPSTVSTGAQERWNLTRTFSGHTGAEGCNIALDAIGRTASDSALLVQRSDASVRLSTADHNKYVGLLAGNEFLATQSESGSALECGNGWIRFRTEARVSGLFSPDGRSLVGTETSVFLLESGKTITRQWEWVATRD